MSVVHTYVKYWLANHRTGIMDQNIPSQFSCTHNEVLVDKDRGNIYPIRRPLLKYSVRL